MITIWDWLAVSLFIVLATTYLNRSVNAAVPGDRVVHYLAPAALLAVANWLGNEGRPTLAVLAAISAVAIFLFVIKPFRRD